MRAAIIGAFFHDRPESRATFGRAVAAVTHRDDRAIEGALYVAELAAACVASDGDAPREPLQAQARRVVVNPQLAAAIHRAVELASAGASTDEAAQVCGTSGFVVHTAAFATFIFLRHGGDPLAAIVEAINAGGDTDSIGAIVGAWTGALHGAGRLPAELVERIHDGPFGPSHLRSLAQALARAHAGEPAAVADYSPAGALFRNLALYPVVLGHGFRRLIP